MNAGTKPVEGWSPRRWCVVYVIVLGLHAAGLWWYGARTPLPVRTPKPVPQWTGAHPSLVEVWPLLDPTFFVHGHPQSFSGPGWMRPPVVEYRPVVRLEPPRFLAPEPGRSLAAYERAATRLAWVPSALDLQVRADPAFRSLVPRRPLGGGPPRLLLADWPCRVHLRGDPPALPSWSVPDLLTNSVVRVLVLPTGRVLSATLLGSCGWEEADHQSLEIARAMEFVLSNDCRDEDPGSGLVPGLLIFQWQSVAPQPGSGP